MPQRPLYTGLIATATDWYIYDIKGSNSTSTTTTSMVGGDTISMLGTSYDFSYNTNFMHNCINSDKPYFFRTPLLLSEEDNCRAIMISKGVPIPVQDEVIQYIADNQLEEEEPETQRLTLDVKVNAYCLDYRTTIRPLPFSGVITNMNTCSYYTMEVNFLPMEEFVAENAPEINVDVSYHCFDGSLGNVIDSGTSYFWGRYDSVVSGAQEFFENMETTRLPNVVKQAVSECIVENSRLLVEQEASIGRRLSMTLDVKLIIGERERFSEYEVHWQNGRSVMELSSTSTTEGTMPASESAIQNLEKIVDIGGLLSEQCSICLEKLCIDILKMPCSHFYHEKCIITWLTKNGVCPLCRSPL